MKNKKARVKRKGNEPYHEDGGLYYTRPYWYGDWYYTDSGHKKRKYKNKSSKKRNIKRK